MLKLDLNGIWQFEFRDGATLEEVGGAEKIPCADRMCVPGCFDVMPRYLRRRGCAVYRREFELAAPCAHAFLAVDGIGLRGAFAVDGREIGSCDLPYSMFELATGALAAGKHVLTARIDNCFDEQKMPLFRPFYDFYAFGGFYGGVSLKLQTAKTELDRVEVRTVDFRKGVVRLSFRFKGEAPETFRAVVRFDRCSEGLSVVPVNGEVELAVPEFRLWSPEHPELHTVRVEVGTDSVVERFGIRRIETEHGKILLNGEPIYLLGFNRHESCPGFGAATPEAVMLQDLQRLKSLHCNFVRGSHYPQRRRFLELCDEMGILVWEESLGWGNAGEQLSDPAFIDAQIRQTRLMVRNNINHPCVVISGFLNEFDSASEAGKSLCRALSGVIRAEESGHLIAFACNRTDCDWCSEYTDLIAYNTYPGWIARDSDCEATEEIRPDRDRIVRFFRSRFGQEKPIIVSEMGISGVYGAHDEAAAQWTEEFQAEYLRGVIESVFEEPEIQGLTLWQMNDSDSYLRKGASLRVKPFGLNLAGSFDGYRRPKLAARVVGELFARKGV